VALRHLPLRPVLLSLVSTVALLLAPSAASAAWTTSPTPNVPGADDTRLNAVDCTSADSCMAVGTAVFPAGFREPRPSKTVAERWNGAGWQIVPTPEPPGATNSTLMGVSCPWRNVCFAVGFWQNVSNALPPAPVVEGPLIEIWNGTSWSIQSGPDVANGGLFGVSCSGLLACTAVGNVYDPSSGDTRPLAERWDGTWRVQSPPENAIAVSCPLRRTCTAVGSGSPPVAERWFGRINFWGLQTAPVPDGVDSASFAGVSCPDGRVCFAVGSSQDSTSHSTTTLAERRVGSRWSVMSTPNPEPFLTPFGLVTDAHLLSVSCPGERACHAFGYGQNSTGDFILIDERFDGVSWQLETIPYGSGVPEPGGISCPNRFFCMAVVHNFTEGTTLAAKWTP
jgi:hypothetical protein